MAKRIIQARATEAEELTAARAKIEELEELCSIRGKEMQDVKNDYEDKIAALEGKLKAIEEILANVSAGQNAAIETNIRLKDNLYQKDLDIKELKDQIGLLESNLKKMESMARAVNSHSIEKDPTIHISPENAAEMIRKSGHSPEVQQALIEILK
jgi:chromosome segregation ATPase